MLRATLLGGKPHEIAVAASVAANRGRRDLVPLMTRALDNEYPLVRYFVHHALGRLTGGPPPFDVSAPAKDVLRAAESWLESRPR